MFRHVRSVLAGAVGAILLATAVLVGSAVVIVLLTGGWSHDEAAATAAPEQLTRQFVSAHYPHAKVSRCRETGSRLEGAALVACDAVLITRELRRDLKLDGKEPSSTTPTACFTVFLRSQSYVVAHGFGSPGHPLAPCFPLHD